MIRLNQRGASILEVVIMSGVMVAMMTGFMSLIGHETKAVGYLEDKLSRVALETELRMKFSNPDQCLSFLNGSVIPQKNKIAHNLKLSGVSDLFRQYQNKNYYDKLEIKDISFENSNFTAPNSSGLVDLVIYPARTRQGGGPETLQPIRIQTTMTDGAGYKIESCSAKEAGAEEERGCVVTSKNLSPTPSGLFVSSYCNAGAGSANGAQMIYDRFASKITAGQKIEEGTVYHCARSARNAGRDLNTETVTYLCINKKIVVIGMDSHSESGGDNSHGN